jgi:excisionase family DNA binding protein
VHGRNRPKHTRIEPPTSRSRNGLGTVVDGANASQDGAKITDREGEPIQPSQPFAENPKDFTTRFTTQTVDRAGAEKAGVPRPPWAGAPRPWLAPGTAPRVATTPSTADLVALHGGRDRLLRVAEVAEMLGVGAWAMYRFCENGDLPHVRINNSIRVRPRDLQEFIASRVTVAQKRRPHRRKEPAE